MIRRIGVIFAFPFLILGGFVSFIIATVEGKSPEETPYYHSPYHPDYRKP